MENFVVLSLWLPSDNNKISSFWVKTLSKSTVITLFFKKLKLPAFQALLNFGCGGLTLKTPVVCFFTIRCLLNEGYQWRIQRFFGNAVLGRAIQGRSPKGHNCELWTTIFSYKHAWMAWVGVIYYGKCNYYLSVVLDIV